MITSQDFIVDSIIAHANKYAYKNINYQDLNTKVSITCSDHGDFLQSPANHLFLKKGCPKCGKSSRKNQSIWLDDLKVPNDSQYRHVALNIKNIKYVVDGYYHNTVYLYHNDYWGGNVNLYNSDHSHPVVNLSYQSLYDKTIARENIFKDAGYNVVSIWESDFLKSQKDNSKIIIQDNKYAQIVTVDSTIFNRLRRHLSFKTQGVEYTPAYKNGWDGVTYLLDNNGYFLIGLLDKVKKFLANQKLKFEVVDNRKLINQNNSIDIEDKLSKLNMIPRSYQKRILDAAIDNSRGIVRACTGSGKTLCTALITAKFNKPTIIYVIGLDLLQQFHSLFSSIFDEPIGFIGNGVCNIHRINVASIWTIGSALKTKKSVLTDDELEEKEISPTERQSQDILKMLRDTKVHIFDESHVVTTDTIKDIFSQINPEHIYGFSGTPFRDDGSDLLINGILGEQIVNVTASELIQEGHLAQPIIKFVRVPKTYLGTGTSNYQVVYKEYISENIIRNNLIINNTKDLLTKNYQVLVLFKHLQHGKNLCQLFDAQNISYEYLSGSDPLEKRLKVKENLLSKKSNLVLASSIFDIGVDISSLSALVLTGGGKSSIRALQRIGRVIRKFPGKKFSAIVDFYDDVKFLKTHSKKRHKIYSTETGFKIIVPKELKKELLGVTDEEQA